MNLKSFFCVVIALIISQFAWARAVLDQEVKNFLSAKINSTQDLLPVLIQFKALQKLPSLAHNSAHHAEIEKAMRNQTLTQQARVFGLAALNSKQSVKSLWILNSALTQLSATQIQKLSESDQVTSIFFSERKIKIQALQNISSEAFGDQFTYGLSNLKIPELRAKYPTILGTGVRVGVIDTGIEIRHPDLKNKLQIFKNFSPAQNQEPEDGFGHGTHVSGTIVGGTASGQSIGVAPNAKIIFARIFDNAGESTLEKILEAMQWVADPDGNPETNDFAQLVNNSWSDDAVYKDIDPQDQPFCQVIESWIKLGMIPVFSAGNTGPDEGTVNIPGACPQALTVGATEQYDRSPRFSSSGPARWKSSSIIKPDISAPGVDIKSCSGRNDYEKMSGTSMAAPHISGVMALILQAQPSLSVEEAIQVLTKNSKDLGDAGKDNTFGWGRADAFKSVEQLLQK